MAAGVRGFRFAMIQMLVGADKAANLQKAARLVKAAVGQGAQMVSLPECFNSPYGTQYFSEYAEPIPGTSTEVLASVAKECKIYLIGGSLPERDGDKLYNTCPVFGPTGDMLGKFRKMHLFDINVPGRMVFQESSVLSPGNSLLAFDTEWCKVGIGICYDLRFPELAALYAQQGCKLLCYPGAFNMTTGPAHWEVLTRARALDNQLYMASVSPARDENASYVVWGHTVLASPWGEVVSVDEKETILYADINLARVDEVRGQIPTGTQKRHDVYAPVSEAS